MTLAASALNATTLRKLVLPSTKARFSASHRRVVDAMRRLAKGRPTLVGRLIGSLTTLPTTVTKLSFIAVPPPGSRGRCPTAPPEPSIGATTTAGQPQHRRCGRRDEAVTPCGRRPRPASGQPRGLKVRPCDAVAVEHLPHGDDELFGRDVGDRGPQPGPDQLPPAACPPTGQRSG